MIVYYWIWLPYDLKFWRTSGGCPDCFKFPGEHKAVVEFVLARGWD